MAVNGRCGKLTCDLTVAYTTKILDGILAQINVHVGLRNQSLLFLRLRDRMWRVQVDFKRHEYYESMTKGKHERR